MTKLVKLFFGLAFSLTLVFYAGGVALADSKLVGFSPNPLEFATDSANKEIVTATVSPAPASALTVKLVANGKVTLGKTTLSFSPTDTTDTFGVTPASGLKSGDIVIITAEGKIGAVTYKGTLEAAIGVVAHPNPNAGKIDWNKVPGTTITDLNVFLNKAITGALWVIALVAFAGLIAAGFMYITAGGDAAKAEKARKTIIWSIVGVILASISYTLLLTAAQFRGIDYTAIPQETSDSGSTADDGSATTGSGVGLTVSDTAGTNFADVIPLDQTTQLSYPLEIVLNSAPAGTVTVELITQGNLPLTLAGSSTMTFDETSWSTPQSFGVSYAGDGQPGQAGQVLIKGSDGSRQTIRFEVPNV
ncbi:hypothetical protein A3A71_00555 [Candidatus Berkelbacteria bacterium RIFCSPLOWO2_01_FULL_50_28]|uniref:Uncharacterized protein n=1 Tax=Candidatus Berkelbacteria bacterium RIFCSPLOWO2_01_FULL_50_28 TaxID=1797471 RepID=A0A1F5EBE4_9BACT|nr:MAG: hypothetical protein A2807_00290 [Candidatus Berkelbacteria bacterium RIFCSPHIGHO2_01_FULL_50_36]OGD63852.1 MAG: hypothetical protein A3F39_03365 [Candidatus Berkelbacteria bacterium RIFCSPHIGHO2_12_FULL_50_11]OGD64534.1 MAG: hypothetical protein A3A71_00555 [Candidatus Berkelbacteria bacterium RIFCSPLOWO2_01_FULL_50_28]